MDLVKKELTKKQQNATNRANALIRGRAFTKQELGGRIGISQPTLRNRLKKNNWKQGEIVIVMNTYPF